MNHLNLQLRRRQRGGGLAQHFNIKAVAEALDVSSRPSRSPRVLIKINQMAEGRDKEKSCAGIGLFTGGALFLG
jgi:hypothetical protein